MSEGSGANRVPSLARRARVGGQKRVFRQSLVLLALLFAGGCATGHATTQAGGTAGSPRSAAIRPWASWQRVLLLQDYNTRVVLLGTSLLGLAGGVVGSLTLLRKRALMGDALSHATLPGIGLVFLLAAQQGYDAKALPLLLAGAAASGLLGVGAILFIRNSTRLKEDAALGIVLSVFFGAGVAVLGVVQQLQAGHAAGLESFIYGKTASLSAGDAWLIAAAGLLCTAVGLLLFKEFRLLCFDEGFAAALGYRILVLDMLLMGLVVVVTIVGLQAVGLILMIALLVIPAAAARFWTEQMTRMTWVAAGLGALSALGGAAASGVFPRLPSGAMIVLVSAGFFLLSLILGPARGVLIRWGRRQRLHRSIDRQHVLRAVYELLESGGAVAGGATTRRRLWPEGGAGPPRELPAVSAAALLAARSWSPRRLGRAVRRTERDGLLRRLDGDAVQLTPAGFDQAARLVHEHRLWELYLIAYADVAPGKVDREADAIEHVLDEPTIARLEQLLEHSRAGRGVPSSPHPLAAPGEQSR